MIKKNNLNLSKNALKIGQAMTSGTLLEAACHPSPGLVNPFSMGAHGDMNFLSFMLGSSTLSPYFSLFGEVGSMWDGKSNLLDELRILGVDVENQLLESTGGSNTQRGILFLGGIVAAASGYIMKRENFSINRLSEVVKVICKDIVDKELKNLDNKKVYTHGEKLYLEHGITGIRGEVERGLPSVVNVSYPRFVKAMNFEVGLNLAMVDSLLKLVTKVEDTTIVSRLGIEGLFKAQKSAKIVMEKGSIYTDEGVKSIFAIDDYFIKENISPGGSADLLAITIGIYILEGGKIDLKQILKGY